METLKAELQNRKKDVAFKVFDPCDKLTKEFKKSSEDREEIKKHYDKEKLYTDDEKEQMQKANVAVMDESKIAFVKVTDVLQKTKIFLNRS